MYTKENLFHVCTYYTYEMFTVGLFAVIINWEQCKYTLMQGSLNLMVWAVPTFSTTCTKILGCSFCRN